MNILIAGANGYLGSQLALSLQDYDVDVLTRKNNNKNFLSTISPDVIINTICSYGRNSETITQIYDSNLYTGISLLEYAKSLDKPITFLNCGTSLEKNTNLYSISKAHLVEFGKFISDDHLQFINMNLQHFYGPNAKNNFISFVIDNCIKNNNLPLTSGLQKRDFIYIDDVVNAFRTVIDNRSMLPSFENIDIGTGSAITVKEVVLKIKELTKSNSILDFGVVPLRDTEAEEMHANVNILLTLGWIPKYNLDAGLSTTINKTI